MFNNTVITRTVMIEKQGDCVSARDFFNHLHISKKQNEFDKITISYLNKLTNKAIFKHNKNVLTKIQKNAILEKCFIFLIEDNFLERYNFISSATHKKCNSEVYQFIKSTLK
jgi:hypothetical protein